MQADLTARFGLIEYKGKVKNIMPLTKTDLKEIKKVVEDAVEEKIEKLAVMVNKGFEEQSKELKEIRKDLAIHDFKMTEMVHRADFYKLEERVFRIEKKVGLKK